jgi:hypothetical protein
VENDLQKGITVLQEAVRRYPGEIEAYTWIDKFRARMKSEDSLRIAIPGQPGRIDSARGKL